MDTWNTLEDVDVVELQGVVDVILPVTATLDASLTLLTGLLTLLSPFFSGVSNPLAAVTDAVVDTLEETALDLLENNVQVAVHTNLTWDPTWVYEDFKKDGVLPWTGTGLEGWLGDLYSSSLDTTDPFRPVTDEDSSTGALFIVLGGPNYGDAAEKLQYLFSAVKDLENQAELLNISDFEVETKKKWWRLGPVGHSEFFSGEVQTVSNLLTESLLAKGAWNPTRGKYPKWVSTPIASLFPVVKDLLEKLRQVIDSLIVLKGNPIDDLIALLGTLSDVLNAAEDTALQLLDALEDVINLLDNASVCWIQPDPTQTGGFQTTILRALEAEGLPNYGSSGVVGGFTVVLTSDDPTNHLERLLQFFNIDVTSLTDIQTSLGKNMQDTYDSHF